MRDRADRQPRTRYAARGSLPGRDLAPAGVASAGKNGRHQVGINTLTEPSVSPASASVARDGYTILSGALRAVDVEDARVRCVAELSQQTLWFGGGTIVGQISYLPPPDLDIIATLITNPSMIQCAGDLLGR